MTSEPFGEVWLTVDDVVALGRSERRVLMNISNGTWTSRPAPQNGRRGRPTREIALSSLPPELQAKYAAQQRAEIITPDPTEAVITDTPVPAVNANDLRLVEVLKPYPADVREAMLSEARRRADIVRRYDALSKKRQRSEVRGQRSENEFQITDSKFQRIGEAGRDASCVRKASADRVGGESLCTVGLGGHSELGDSAASYDFVPEVYALCEEARCTNRTIVDYFKSRQHSIRKGNEPRITKAISPVTLDGWSRRFKKEGIVAFLPAVAKRESSDKRVIELPRAATDWLSRNYKLKPHARALYQDYQKAARRRGWPMPSAHWFYRKWKTLPLYITATLRSEKRRVDRFASYYPRDVRELDMLQIVCGDHSERDVFVRLPDGSLVRPVLSSWQCVRGGLLWGWSLNLIPSSRTIGLAYAHGVRTFGAQPPSRPDEGYFSYIYTDQGKDYRSHAIAGKTITFKRAAAIEGGLAFLCDQRGTEILNDQDERHVGLINELGLKHFLARGYNAREKGVERFHRDLSGWESKTFEAEYCGPDAKNKPDAFQEAYARHLHLLAKVKKSGNMPWLDESPFMLFDDYRDALAGRIYEYNHETHQRSTLGGVTVVPAEEYERLYTTPYTISEQAMAMILLKAEKRMVGKNGVAINGFQYLDERLAFYKGMEVEVRYDDADFKRVWIIPPATERIPHPPMIEAEALIRGGILNPNRDTQRRVKKQEKFERQLRKDLAFVNQSGLRGESVEDRVAMQLAEEEIQQAEELIAVAAGGGSVGFGGKGHGRPAASAESTSPRSSATVHLLTGHDFRKRVGAPASRPITVDEVSSASIDESIFADESEESQQSGNLVRMWEDEE